LRSPGPPMGSAAAGRDRFASSRVLPHRTGTVLFASEIKHCYRDPTASAGRGSSGVHPQLRRGPADGDRTYLEGIPQACMPGHTMVVTEGQDRADVTQPVLPHPGRAGASITSYAAQDQLIDLLRTRSGPHLVADARSVLCSPAGLRSTPWRLARERLGSSTADVQRADTPDPPRSAPGRPHRDGAGTCIRASV